MFSRGRTLVAAGSILLALARAAAAQDWTADARDIALGGTGITRALSTSTDRSTRDTVIVLPLGLLQVLRDVRIYDPGSPRFDPVRAAMYLSSPLHFIVNRAEPPASLTFIDALRSGIISPIRVVDSPGASGATYRSASVFAPTAGETISVREDDFGNFHGIYLGAGPYVTVGTDVSETGSINGIPLEIFSLSSGVEEQIAAAVTVGYRGRFATLARDLTFDLAIDYNYLHGLLYNRDELVVELPANFPETATTAIGLAARSQATRGTGRSVNLGVGVLFGPWRVSLNADGIGNRIRWRGIRDTTVVEILDDGTSDVPAVSIGETRVIRLPVAYRVDGSYAGEAWTFAVGLGHGFGGASVNAGIERRFGEAALRGGVRYSFGRWSPAAGVGVPLSPRVSLDVAAFGTTANFERRRQLAIAVSFRLRAF